MGEVYFNLKRKLEELGYNNVLPLDAVPLVECLLADLLQTTRSLQHYMDLSKEAMIQRDSLMMEAEPYKCDNAKLIQENNQMHREIMLLKEESIRLNKESRRKIKAVTDEVTKKDDIISKLQHDLRDLSLRGLCADTQSSRNKSKRKDIDYKICMCNDRKVTCNDKDISELMRKLQLLEEKNNAYTDEIILLKSQVEHRDNEIIRLNILLEGGRPLAAINKDCCNLNNDVKVTQLSRELQELESANGILKKEIEVGLEKQHEAMLRALSLADKNKALQEELQKVDTLALKVEEDANKRLAAMINDMNFLQTKIEGLTMKNSELERELFQSNEKVNSPKLQKLQDSLNSTLKENNILHKEIKDLIELNKSLQDKILSLTNVYKTYQLRDECEHIREKNICPTKDELQKLLEDERRKYEKYIFEIQQKMTETINVFNKHLFNSKEKEVPKYQQTSYESVFIKDLHSKLCESEQKILMLKKELDDYKAKVSRLDENSKQNFKDVISQLNIENAELSTENITLSQQLSHYRNLNTTKYNDRADFVRKDILKLKDTIDQLTDEIRILKKDKQEYNLRYKEALEISDKLKRDLIMKQKEIEQLEEENNSYKMTHRNGKASAEHLREECNFLREQIKKMQTDVIKEKTLANQIKNIQLETERSTTEVQNELLSTQKKLSLSKDTIDGLERNCKELHSEVVRLRNDKSNLIDNLKKIDQERDKLVIDLDHKTETISVLEQKLKSQAYDATKLENELSELKRQLNINKVSEHKLVDYEGQINFLNNEILRLTQQFDNAIIENKHLQNSLADASGTLKITKIEYDKSRKEVDGLKQQLQHYVAEIRRIEELLSQKEAERSDMLEQFASLSVEANILENTNHSLESESVSKSIQLQSYVMKIQDLEGKLSDKESIIDSQLTRIASMTYRINSLENEIKLIMEEKIILEQNISYLKQMCNNLQTEHSSAMKGIGDVDSELKLYENRIKSLSNAKANLEVEKDEVREKLATTETLLSNARREIVELKLALQDATTETKSLQSAVTRLSRRDSTIHETTLTKQDLDVPLMLEEIHEVSQEEDENSSHYHSSQNRLSKYSHGGTL
ncbi:hypothetical protein K1T71_006027 [Dendrolimus kikuchii]|uniref:Uncharacterized protein n=1 Tax=Dendrolimus kikuchii TaxID=765133 RepID=A0ACC1D2M0_9NEOP|nr:hypothetical protein K1T71_006027 [Dendrolimus kikuchii]